MERIRRLARSLVVLALVSPAAAMQSSPIDVHDLAGSNNEWQEGVAVVNAPIADVKRWLSDYDGWHRIFPDVEWVQRLGRDKEGRDVVRFRSRYAGRVITLHQRNSGNLMSYEGWGPNVHTQGRTYLIALGANRTKVIMQTSAEVHGFSGVFASHGLKRDRAYKALRGHLAALLAEASRR